MVIENLQFIHEEGDRAPFEVTLYALSTCGFCRKSIMFLKENRIKFRYVHVDLLDFETKEKVKRYLTEKFSTRLGFPFAVLDDREFLRGFNREEWEKKFSV